MSIALPVIGQVVSKSTFGDPVVNALNAITNGTGVVTSGASTFSGTVAITGTLTVTGASSAVALGIVAWGNRTTTSTTFTSTEQGVLRLDSIPVVNGREYLIVVPAWIPNSTVASDAIETFFRVSTSGAATTSSTQMEGGTVMNSRSAAATQFVLGASARYKASATGTISILLSGVRSAGTGTCSLVASAGKYALNMLVYDMGVGVSDTGVDI